MFEIGFDQAAGLRGEALRAGAALMPVACPAQPARAYEMLCSLAAVLTALGREVVIVDGSAQEASERRSGHDGSHLGLQHALQDPSISGLGRAPEGAEWLVMPAAHGLQTLLRTTQAAGAAVALGRLLSPFSPEALVILFAPASNLGALLGGLRGHAMVPVLPQAQANIDAYSALKQLHAAGLTPVLAPAAPTESQPLQEILDSVTECALQHLGLKVATWPEHTWGLSVQENALTRQSFPNGLETQPSMRSSASGARHGASTQPIWS